MSIKNRIRKTLALLFGRTPVTPSVPAATPSSAGAIFVLLPDSWVRPRQPWPRVEGTDDIDWAIAVSLAIAAWYGGSPHRPLPRHVPGYS